MLDQERRERGLFKRKSMQSVRLCWMVSSRMSVSNEREGLYGSLQLQKIETAPFLLLQYRCRTLVHENFRISSPKTRCRGQSRVGGSRSCGRACEGGWETRRELANRRKRDHERSRPCRREQTNENDRRRENDEAVAQGTKIDFDLSRRMLGSQRSTLESGLHDERETTSLGLLRHGRSCGQGVRRRLRRGQLDASIQRSTRASQRGAGKKA